MPNAGEAKAPWHQRKGEYLHKLCREDASSLLVSASDKLHNAGIMPTEVLAASQRERAAFFGISRQGRDGTLQYYRLLADIQPVVPGGQHAPRLRMLFAKLESTVTALKTLCGVTSEEMRRFSLSLRTNLPASVCAVRTQRNPETLAGLSEKDSARLHIGSFSGRGLHSLYETTWQPVGYEARKRSS